MLETIPRPEYRHRLQAQRTLGELAVEGSKFALRPPRRSFLQATGVLAGGLGLGFLRLFPTSRAAAHGGHGAGIYSCTSHQTIRSINAGGVNAPCGYSYTGDPDPQYPGVCRRCAPSTVCEDCCDSGYHKIENCNEATEPVGSYAHRPGKCEDNTDGWHWMKADCCPSPSDWTLVSRCHDGFFILGTPTIPKTRVKTICPKSWCADPG